MHGWRLDIVWLFCYWLRLSGCEYVCYLEVVRYFAEYEKGSKENLDGSHNHHTDIATLLYPAYTPYECLNNSKMNIESIPELRNIADLRFIYLNGHVILSQRQNLTNYAGIPGDGGCWWRESTEIWVVSDSRIHTEIQGKFSNWGLNEREVSPNL